MIRGHGCIIFLYYFFLNSTKAEKMPPHAAPFLRPPVYYSVSIQNSTNPSDQWYSAEQLELRGGLLDDTRQQCMKEKNTLYSLLGRASPLSAAASCIGYYLLFGCQNKFCNRIDGRNVNRFFAASLFRPICGCSC